MLSLERSRYVAVAVILALIFVQLQMPAMSKDEPLNMVAQSGTSVPSNQATLVGTVAATCPDCGFSFINGSTAPGAGKMIRKDRSLLTDSLWGNLILEMAYQRDSQLAQIAREMNWLNIFTLGSVFAISGGTLVQGVDAIRRLNPPNGGRDSYVPIGIGVGFSGLTIITLLTRLGVGHHLSHKLFDKQLALKYQVENVLAHLQYCDARCPDARKELTELVGERACDEWVQLWRSSHKLAVSTPPHIALDTQRK